MPEKFKKIDKEYLITDSTVNCYGFRLLTDGYMQSEFEKNPIGYYMHLRDDGVVVRWEDFRRDGDKVFAKPVINLSNQRGQQTVDEILNNFLNAASVGHYVIAELSDDPALKLPGQTGPTVTKWYNRELSLVDIPGNYNALADLFDVKGNRIENLAAFNPQTSNMKTIVLTAGIVTALNLKADAEQSTVETAFNDLLAKANKVEGLESQVQNLTAEKTDLETKLSAEKSKSIDSEVASLLEKGLADKKLTVNMKDKLSVDYKGNPTGLKSLLDTLPTIGSVTAAIKDQEKAGIVSRLAALTAKSWDDLDRSGELQELKSLDEGVFKAKYKETFKEEWDK